MIPRISPSETHAKVQTGAGLLVCAYGSDDTCRDYYLHGAMLPSAFQAKVPSLPKDQEIIFYCAWSAEHTSAGRAEEYQKQGFTNVKALAGGVAAWKEAGLPLQSA